MSPRSVPLAGDAAHQAQAPPLGRRAALTALALAMGGGWLAPVAAASRRERRNQRRQRRKRRARPPARRSPG